MKTQSRHSIELALDLTNLNSYGRGLNAPQVPNHEGQTQDTQDSQPACDNGICELNWKPSGCCVA